MASAKLSLLSLAQIEAENGSWKWNPSRNPSLKLDEEGAADDSWEVRAFAEDYTASTWPPKFYTCSFCKRQFRSAQALGGHMNVHRRDRASRRLHHRSLPPRSATSAATSGIVIPAQELGAAGNNGGLCGFYQLPRRNGGYHQSNNGVIVPSANSIPTMSSDVEDLDLELRLGTGR